MTIDPSVFNPAMVSRLARLQAAGLTHASWTCVYDGDELETCSVDLRTAHGRVGPYDGAFKHLDVDETLIYLCGGHRGEAGSYILNLEDRKFYRTHEAWREMKLVERPLPTPDVADLSGLDLRTQAEKDY